MRTLTRKLEANSHGARFASKLVGLAIMALFLAPSSAAAATPSPAWDVTSLPTPTNFIPGDTAHDYTYDVRVANVGAVPSDGSPITITDTLPEGLTVESVELPLHFSLLPYSANPFDFGSEAFGLCSVDAGPPAVVTCTLPDKFPEAIFGPTSDEPAVIQPSEEVRMVVHVKAPSGMPARTMENRVVVNGGGAGEAVATSHNATTDESNPQPASAGFTYAKARLTDSAGRPVAHAGARPYQFTTSFAVNTKFAPTGNVAPFVPAGGDVKNVRVELPPGLVGNPTVSTKCSAKDFNEFTRVDLEPAVFYQVNSCPNSSAVGFVRVQQVDGTAGLLTVPLYNLVPPPGMPAQFGFQINGIPFFIDTEVRPDRNYRIIAGVRNTSQAKRVTAASVTLWGEPSDPSHDPLRGNCLNTLAENAPLSHGVCPAEIINKPSFRLPTSCSTPMNILMSFDNWTTPGVFASMTTQLSPAQGCAAVGFAPSLRARPTTDTADSPSGLSVDLRIPQNETPGELGSADVRTTVVTLPKGLVINPSGANGLDVCTPSQIGLKQSDPPLFDNEPARCPDAARIGTIEVNTPLIDHPLPGSVYVAAPHDNPFDSLLAIYLAVYDRASGIVVKLAGKVEPDSQTGQLRSVFADTPQQPFEDFKLNFFGGPLAALRTPAVCGPYRTTSSMTPWSAPASGPPATPFDVYAIGRSPSGGPCPTSTGALPVQASFEAGTETPLAGAYSPMVIRLSRPDGSQEFGALTLTPPPGLLARLAGIPYCPDAALAAAAGKSGREEESSPSCPAASRVGTVTVAAGAGPRPYYTGGTAYLAGPYKGAPLSLAIVTPATAGPYDLGTVVVRTALHVDPRTARITAESDPIPHILKGIPLDVRSIVVRLDHPGWGLNPTSCEPSSFGGRFTGVPGGAARLSSRFQVGGCDKLRFKPRLSLSLKGATKRTGHPALKAVVTYPVYSGTGCATPARRAHRLSRKAKKERHRAKRLAGGRAARRLSRQARRHARQARRLRAEAKRCLREGPPREANIARAQVGLPHSEFLDQGNLNKVCKQADLRAATCPKSSVYGHAKAWTPLLDKPLQGPVYLGVGFGYKLPALVADLDGQIRILLVGRIDTTKRKGIRNTFEVVPDAPVSRFVLTMKGGRKYGLIENSENLCRKTQRASALFNAQNGLRLHMRPKIANSCGKKRRKSKKRVAHSRARTRQGAAHTRRGGRSKG